MDRYDPLSRRLAIALAALAGFVDAIGFIKTGGHFVSFMSGNSTMMAVNAAQAAGGAALAATLILSFLIGVILGALLAIRAGTRRKAVILAALALLLAVAAGLQMMAADYVAITLLAGAMGLANNVFQRDGEVSVGVTYMTGTLVKLGQRIAEALLGGRRTAWVPFLLLWLGLLAGSVAGAWLCLRIPDAALWIAAAFAAALVPVALRLSAQARTGNGVSR